MQLSGHLLDRSGLRRSASPPRRPCPFRSTASFRPLLIVGPGTALSECSYVLDQDPVDYLVPQSNTASCGPAGAAVCDLSLAGCGEGQSMAQAPQPNLAALAAPVSPMPLPDSRARVLMETTRHARQYYNVTDFASLHWFPLLCTLEPACHL